MECKICGANLDFVSKGLPVFFLFDGLYVYCTNCDGRNRLSIHIQHPEKVNIVSELPLEYNV